MVKNKQVTWFMGSVVNVIIGVKRIDRYIVCGSGTAV